ncbi:MAG TPA: methenyltetrahydromethanopterin cyclohydrolase [Gemmatimonadaceae bacterium]|nr:methenyltetrahydromethanopterin cyclohydrolase [Gemmatimonadaceae bacterium]
MKTAKSGGSKGSSATAGANAAHGSAPRTTKASRSAEGVAASGIARDHHLNERAWAIADELESRADELRIAVTRLPSGSRVIDAGVATTGGIGAGIGLASLCMSGLGNISVIPLLISDTPYPGIQVWTDHPALACVASQYAGWAIKVDKYFALASGPLRAHARVETELFDKLGYSERADRGVLVLEGRQLPDDAVAKYVAGKSHLDPSAITFAIAPTASLAGSVQVVARSIETGLHKMDAVGFDVTRVVSGIGTAPIPPVAKDDIHAIGRTNDSILYGGEVRLVIDASDAELEELAKELPASSSSDYGTPFYDIFTFYEGDFYKIDKHLFSPGEVWLTSATSGRTFHGGKLDPRVLRKSLLG